MPNFLALAIVAAAVMSPWAIRNQQVFGKPILTTTHGGYTLLLGNNASFYHHLLTDRSGVPWSADDFHLPLRDTSLMHGWEEPSYELRMNAFCYSAAKEEISNVPGAFAYACTWRVGQLWSPLPHKLTMNESTGRRALRYLTAAWYGGVYVLAAVGVWRLRWRLVRQPWVWGMLLCLAFTAVHTLYWSNLRMRAPLMPFVAIVAAGAISRLENPQQQRPT